ncbi:MAG: nuclear transport factor 2 family protein [Janthinobacterium lividum]
MLTTSDELQNVTSRYVRNVDSADHPAQMDLFCDDAVVRVFASSDSSERLLHGPIVGGRAFVEASFALRAPIPAHRRTRHCTFDRLLTVDGDSAATEMQFLVVHTERLGSGECRSTIVETGAYRFGFRRIGYVWLISKLDIIIDMPESLTRVSVQA